MLDYVRDCVAHLGVGLVRMQRRRHHLTEIFRPDTAPAAASEEGAQR
jgi:ABC-2 type transport system ATP-binding protein